MLKLKCFVITRLVPAYLRRAILMCSLAATLTKAERSEYEHIAEQVCNELSLDYAYGHAAMVSPMQWGSRIWAGLPPIEIDHQPSGKTLYDIATSVFANVPQYLAYSNKRTMLDDIFATLRVVGKCKTCKAETA